MPDNRLVWLEQVLGIEITDDFSGIFHAPTGSALGLAHNMPHQKFGKIQGRWDWGKRLKKQKSETPADEEHNQQRKDFEKEFNTDAGYITISDRIDDPIAQLCIGIHEWFGHFGGIPGGEAGEFLIEEAVEPFHLQKFFPDHFEDILMVHKQTEEYGYTTSPLVLPGMLLEVARLAFSDDPDERILGRHVIGWAAGRTTIEGGILAHKKEAEHVFLIGIMQRETDELEKLVQEMRNGKR